MFKNWSPRGESNTRPEIYKNPALPAELRGLCFLVAEPGVEPGALGHEPKMLPLHHSALFCFYVFVAFLLLFGGGANGI